MKLFLPVLICSSCCLTTNAADSLPHRIGTTNVVRLSAAYLNQLAEQMRTNHPSLRAAAARTRAADAATNSVRIWADPELTFGGTVADGARGPELREDGDLLYGVEQKLPLFGKPQAVRRMVRAEAEAEGTRAELQFQNLRRDLAKTLFRAAHAERIVDLGRQDLVWLEALSTVAEERYRAGNGSQIEVLRLQNERARRAELLRTEERHRDHELLTINRFLDRELHAPLAKFELPGIAGVVAYTPRLVELAVKHEPRLRVMRREIETAQASVAAARKARLPDLAGFADARQYSGDGGFREATFGIKMSLPWFNHGRYQSDVARERARLEAAQADTADQEQAIREEVHHVTVNIDAARREALLYREQIIPRSEQALTVARENWLNNRGTFSEVMEARRLFLEAQLGQSRAVSEQYQLMAQLVLCCGLADFEMLQTLGITEDNSSSDPSQR